MHRLADKFPPRLISLIDIGPSTEQLLENKEKPFKEAAGKNDKENAGLRAKVDFLQKHPVFVSKDRYTLVREKCVLQNKLEDFNQWPELDPIRSDEEVAGKRSNLARANSTCRAAGKIAEAMSGLAHSEELKLAKQERDDEREMYQTLLATTTAVALNQQTSKYSS